MAASSSASRTSMRSNPTIRRGQNASNYLLTFRLRPPNRPLRRSNRGLCSKPVQASPCTMIPVALQLRLPWSPLPPRRSPRAPAVLSIEGRPFPLVVTRHRRARRYLLRVTQEGALRLTVPQGGSIAAGIRFAASQAAWILQEWGRRRAATDWRAGTLIWHRGVPTAIAV